MGHAEHRDAAVSPPGPDGASTERLDPAVSTSTGPRPVGRPAASRPVPPRFPGHRLAILALGVVSVLGGLDAGLIRLGAAAPVGRLSLGDVHGALMIYGFLGTVICLERAVALQSGAAPRAGARAGAQPGNQGGAPADGSPSAPVVARRVPTLWAYAAPIAAGIGGIAAVVGATAPLPPMWSAHARLLPGLAWILAMALLSAIYATIWRTRQQSYALLLQVLGSLAGVGGIALWTQGRPVAVLVVWWLAFPVLTIIGERLELARVGFAARRPADTTVRPPGTAAGSGAPDATVRSGSPGGPRPRWDTEPRILTWACLLVLALPLTLLVPAAGYPLLGAALAALIVDTAWHDVARHTVRLPGLPRLAGVCMLSGYAWALVPAGLWMVAGPVPSGHGYDVAVHCLALGFTVSMILAHAPIIVPAILRRPLPYHPVMWVAWALLEAGLLLRVVAGVHADEGAWRLGGALGVSAMLVFLLVTAGSVLVAASRSGRTARPSTRATAAPLPSPHEGDPARPAGDPR